MVGPVGGGVETAKCDQNIMYFGISDTTFILMICKIVIWVLFGLLVLGFELNGHI